MNSIIICVKKRKISFGFLCVEWIWKGTFVRVVGRLGDGGGVFIFCSFEFVFL